MDYWAPADVEKLHYWVASLVVVISIPETCLSLAESPARPSLESPVVVWVTCPRSWPYTESSPLRKRYSTLVGFITFRRNSSNPKWSFSSLCSTSRRVTVSSRRSVVVSSVESLSPLRSFTSPNCSSWTSRQSVWIRSSDAGAFLLLLLLLWCMRVREGRP